MRKLLVLRHPSILVFLAVLAVFTLAVTMLSAGYGTGAISTSMVKTLGKTLCLALAAVAMDLVWGYVGILSLGQMAFFALGGYMIGQWLMYARTETIVAAQLAQSPIPATPQELQDAVTNQIFGVVGSSDLPMVWSFAHSLPLQLLLVVAVPGLLALVFGWLAFRSRVNGVYLSILTQAMTLALALWLRRADHVLRPDGDMLSRLVPDTDLLRQVLQLGLPTGVQLVVGSLSGLVLVVTGSDIWPLASARSFIESMPAWTSGVVTSSAWIATSAGIGPPGNAAWMRS